MFPKDSQVCDFASFHLRYRFSWSTLYWDIYSFYGNRKNSNVFIFFILYTWGQSSLHAAICHIGCLTCSTLANVSCPWLQTTCSIVVIKVWISTIQHLFNLKWLTVHSRYMWIEPMTLSLLILCSTSRAPGTLRCQTNRKPRLLLKQ